MAGIVLELQNDLLNNKAPLSQLMVKAYVVARKLRLHEWSEAFKRDIYGYSTFHNIPADRKVNGVLQTRSKLKTFMSSTETWSNVFKKSPIGLLASGGVKAPPATQDILVPDSIKDLERLAEQHVELSKTVDMPYDYYRLNLPSSANDCEFRVIYNSDAYIHVLDKIKMSLIEWTLALSDKGILGDGLEFNKEEQKMAQTINAQNVMVQNHPINSPQQLVINNNQLELFDKLLEAAQSITENQEIIASIEAMKSAIEHQNHKSYLSYYQQFIGIVANHMAVFGPFMQPLAAILG